MSSTRHLWRLNAVAAIVGAAVIVSQTAAFAQLASAAAELTRAPYLTDLTASSVQVTWATTTQTRGVVGYGPVGSCDSGSITSVPMGSPITVNGVREYHNSVTLTGLMADTTYCYRVFTGDPVRVDLLGATASPQFTTLVAQDAPTPFSFAVLGDWGDTTNGGLNTGAMNVGQAGVDAQIAASGVRFALSTGDVGYPGGTQTSYGDLNQSGANVSAVFAPAYWGGTGSSVPLHGVSGNHGQNATFLSVWPQSTSTAVSAGTYEMVSYPSIIGTTPASLPTSYYAFSTGGVRFYVLDASWSDTNVGTATGGPCGSHCAMYEVDRAAHWTAISAQYQWLARDLAAHPGGLKVAAFHFPLRSDDAGQPSDVYLQNRVGGSESLERLLYDAGVRLVFNGHSHTYQRHVAPPGGVTAYVTGGGGARPTSIGGAGCGSTDAYGVGWSYTKGKGNACGSAVAPLSDTQVYHFLKVSVSGNSVTVAPTDSQGDTFDVQTYDFSADGVAPSAPGALTVAPSVGTAVALSWSPASDNIGVSAYDIYRSGAYVATVAPTVTSYLDAGTAAAGYSYQVRARDLAGNSTGGDVVSTSGVADTVAPSTPTGLTATVTGPTGVSLSWNGSTDNTAVLGYTIYRGSAAVAAIPGATTAWSDLGLVPGSTVAYHVVAVDAAGNAAASDMVEATTVADSAAPSAPGTPTTTGVTTSQVGLRWTVATDTVGVARYEVVRGSTVIAIASGTTYVDATVAPGTTYSYLIRAVDAAGNVSASATLTLTTPVPGSVFLDGFESGTLGQWSTVSSLNVQSAVTHSGGYAVRQSSTGTATYAYKTLGSTSAELWAQVWVNVVSRSTSVNLLGFRTSGGGSMVNVYLDANGRVSLRNNVGTVTTYGGSVVGAGWHRIVLHAAVNGTSSSLDVSLDGLAVPGLTLTGQDLGSSPIAKLQLGETSTGRTYDVVMDDVLVSFVAL